MPVRIYEIAKKLGLDSKVVLTRARELGITHVKAASSTLDKITAEWLENELAVLVAPPIAVPIVPALMPPEAEVVFAPPALPAPEPHTEEVLEITPLQIVESPPPAPPEPLPPVEMAPAPAPLPAPEPESAPVVPAAPAVPEVVPVAEPPPPPPPAPPPPPPPPAPKMGDLVGRIQLPTRPKPAEKSPPPRPGTAPARPDAQRPRFDQRGRPDARGARPGTRPAAPGAPAARRPGDAARPTRSTPGAPSAAPRFVAPSTGEVIIHKGPIVVRDLADRIGQKPFKIIADLMGMGVFANVNQMIDEQTAQRVCASYGFRFETEKRERGGGVHAPLPPKAKSFDPDDKPEDLKLRAPVVTIMGHVDHGKTTLLDGIRKANVAAGESGGITQHIGAYTITVPHPEKKGELRQITFLDTPGHAAFSAMRARGANVTDIVVLVVAANDGVMPQTLEALSHAKAAKVPILVAVNKIDHPNANPMKVRQQLQDRGLVPDDWGGDTIYVDVSALQKTGVDKLLEMLLLQADLLELKANPSRRAVGNVVESGIEPGGPVATVLVRKGTLRTGDVVICGQYFGKVRALISEEGDRLKEAGPSFAVKVLGLNGVPPAGEEFQVAADEKAARALGEERAQAARLRGQESRSKITLENLFDTLAATDAKVLKLIVKADTQGSVEAIVDALRKIESAKVALEIIHSDVGTITENDVALASASSAIILGFHTRLDSSAAEAAKSEGVQIKLYSIIYELIDQVQEAMAGLLDPLIKEVVIGMAEVRKVFALSKGLPVAGCIVSHGRIARGKVRVVRRKHVIYEGVTQSLRHFQDEVPEVRVGNECGIRIEGFSEIAEGDVIECYVSEKVAAKL
jgi:translation initiation factor IF-2